MFNKFGFEPIKNWNNESEKQLIKLLYDAIEYNTTILNKIPVFKFIFTDGTEVIAKYHRSFTDANSISALYYGKEIPEHLKGERDEYYYLFLFYLVKIIKKGYSMNFINENSLFEITYHDFPINFELVD